jgi:hypothetical protein
MAKQDMRDFLLRQWNDIRGNVKYGLLLTALTLMLIGFTTLTHGLMWWQQACLVAIFSVVFVWAIAATVVAREESKKQIKQTKEGDNAPATTPEQPALRTRVLDLCDDLRAWRRDLGSKPKEPWNTNMGAMEFVDQYRQTVLPWEMKHFHGFHLKFAGRVEALYHELGICALGSNDLEAAFARMCKGVSDPQENDATVIADQLAELATKL